MITTIRQGTRAFYGDIVFPHGISRSGFFNKRESEELIAYGETLQKLALEQLTPCNNEEQQFIEALNTPTNNDFYPAKLWQKYTLAVETTKRRHGFINSSTRSSHHPIESLI